MSDPLSVALLAVLLLAGAGLFALAARRCRARRDRRREILDRWADGEFSARLPTGPGVDPDGSAALLNRAAESWQARVAGLAQQGAEWQAVFSSMHEAVLAVGTDEAVMMVNPAAARWLGLPPEQTLGRNILEVIRDLDVQQLVRSILRHGEPAAAEITLRGPDTRILSCNGTPLRNAAGARSGVVVVLNDITALRRLEKVRSDFVANVSHELKTPVTAIKGYVETLLDGALRQPAECEKFLRIVLRQANRLQDILEDLLSLSRLEQDPGQAHVEFQWLPVQRLLEGAAQACARKAEARNIRLRLPDAGTARVWGNGNLLEQALVNLLDNAIQYSVPGQTVEVDTQARADGREIAIRDHGCGISPQHLPRIFERFYRVDKARSRQRGGTGLGLAIVKHIAQVHGGRVLAASNVNEGSVFTLVLPDAPASAAGQPAGVSARAGPAPTTGGDPLASRSSAPAEEGTGGPQGRGINEVTS